MKLKCMVCYKDAEVMAYGNTYCKEHFEQSPYYMERIAKERIEGERKEKQK